ncbi:protocadherin alpha 2 [Camelus ferus]|nr:protocadherin alpha 2 [Camelus ferus]
MYSNPVDPGNRPLLLFFIILGAWETRSGQIQYSILEEAKHGTFVGRIAQDLGLELAELMPRLFRVASKGRKDLLEVNLQNGILFVNSRIDREELCGRSAECSIHLEVIVDRPLQVFHVEVEVKDINDNPPVFPGTQKNLFIAESRPLNSRFPLEGASDADIGENAQLTYTLSPNEYFSLDVPTTDQQVKPLGLVLRKPLDREESPELHLVLLATDRGKPELTGTVQLLVKVLDANDNAPAFDRTLYGVKLPENIPNGTLVIKLNASDLDEGLNGDIVYSLSSDVSPDIKVKFYIDPVSGEITAIGNIDFEESKAYKIRVEAIDKGLPPLAGHCTVLVEVVDANDNAPELTEGACGPGKPRLVCSSAVGSLSYSQQRRQRVCSGEGPPKTDLMAFSPSVPPFPDSEDVGKQQDLNMDHCPEKKARIFEMLYSSQGDQGDRDLLLLFIILAAWETGSGQVRYSVPEEAKHGTFVGHIAQDLRLELQELVPRLFHLDSKGHGDLLEVNLQNGILFVNSRIDREELCGRSAECSIHLEVIVDRPLQVFHVEVEVKDINDNPPVFPGTQKNLFIAESRPLNSRFPLEGASDADIGENAQLTYTLSPNEYFSLDVPTTDQQVKPLGLVLRKPLDREESPELHLVLLATDRGKPELTGTVQLLVKVLDANDNAPAFDRTLYGVKLPENIPNGTLVIKLNASDLDEGLNGDIVYSLSSDVSPDIKVKFYIDPVSGEITAIGNIDFEESKAYKIRVEAIDKGLPPLAGHCTVLVEVVDANDNAPELTVTSLSLPVSEDAQPGTVITLINVSDRDSGTNGQVTCFLTPQVPFKLVSTFKNYYSLVLDSSLDRETVANYKLVVTARDGGSPSLSATASVSVDVADVNDNAPTFAQPEYTVFVKENNPPGCHIFTVSARDADAQENALVSYSLVERRVGERALSSYVSVHAESGKVYALQPLDHEELELLQFQVSARDAGVPPLGSNVTLQVFVLDENDNAPALLPPGPGGVAGAVSQLVARSEKDMLFYSLSGPRTQRLLLSFLLVAAWEAGSGQVHYSVPEEAKHGTFVGRIAQDLGLEVAELVPRLFRVVSKVRGDLLEVNLQNGILFVNSRIDREELCGRSAECSIHLEVIVDRPLQVFHVEVEVKDINDNPPVFSASEQKLSIPESRLLDSRFPLEGASDADVGENAMLTYRLSPNEFFTLDIINKKDKGKFPVLVLQKLLDREENPQLQLLLTATDGGKPELKGSVTLQISVLDANDNAPIFDRSIYEVKMYENSANQTLVIWLNASDADEGINKEIIYSFSSLVPPNIRRKFLMNERTGEIRVNDAIDFEDSNTYEIHVDVTDKGTPPMVGHCSVLLEILDENDNSPEVVVTSLALPVREDAQVGTVIALISVSDHDSGANGQVICSLTPHIPFKLVSTFKNYYSLVLESALDRESVANYELVVTARDGGSPSLSATASVSVDVSDVNDNAPTFAQPEYTVFVKENNPPGCHIFTVSARDADAQENALVSYSLVERRVGERALSSYVSVHAESGKVYALQPLDHEELELLQFQVSARDAGVPPLGSNVTLQVFVLDENDNAPALLPPGPGGVAGAVSQLVARPFRVGLYTGEISTTRALDEADAPRQRLLVLVKDHGEPALTATATVLLSLEDSGQAPKASSRASTGAAGAEAALVDVNVYLIVAICAVSSLFVLTLLLYTALRCSAPPSEGACGPGKPRLVCSSAVGSWSYSQQRRQRVCSGEGPPKADLMAFSPSLPPCPLPAVEVEEESTEGDHCSKKRGTMLASGPGGAGARPLLLSFLLLATWEAGSGQVHYSVSEEAKHGTFVGRIAQDLGLELAELVPRLFRVASKGPGDLLEVNLQNGILFVNSRIDREELCGRSAECSIHLEVIVDRPLQVFHVEVEVKDINDNPPVFPATHKNLFISESRALDSHFSLEGASDADIGTNALLTYRLSPNEYFSLDTPTNDEQIKPLELVLKKPLDREAASELLLVLKATDGGKPELTGTVDLHITVLDVNDNAPVFDKAVLRIKLLENARNGTMVIRLNASDLDEGLNGHILYSFATDVSPNTEAAFRIDSISGEIKVNGKIDFEENKLWKLHIEAVDKGNPPMFGHCTILIDVLDINDNAPELLVTSLLLSVPEDALLGTVIALISVTDRDAGGNGQVICSLAPEVPFKLVSTFKNYYSLVLDSTLDRESVANYELVVTARDGGSPSLSATASVSVDVSDVNDNAPTFAQPEYTVFVKENNPPGCHIFTVSARDADAQENALVSYSLVERRVGERALSSYVSVHAESGKVYALQPLDHEELELLQFQVSARDAGVPPLGSNVTLQVFVLDENDNAPNQGTIPILRVKLC